MRAEEKKNPKYSSKSISTLPYTTNGLVGKQILYYGIHVTQDK